MEKLVSLHANELAAHARSSSRIFLLVSFCCEPSEFLGSETMASAQRARTSNALHAQTFDAFEVMIPIVLYRRLGGFSLTNGIVV